MELPEFRPSALALAWAAAMGVAIWRLGRLPGATVISSFRLRDRYRFHFLPQRYWPPLDSRMQLEDMQQYTRWWRIWYCTFVVPVVALQLLLAALQSDPARIDWVFRAMLGNAGR